MGSIAMQKISMFFKLLWEPQGLRVQPEDKNERLYLLFLFACVGVLALSMLHGWHLLPGTSDPDALQMLSHARVMADAVRNYGEFPLWNPYFGGGFPWTGFVYNTGLSVVSLFYIFFGELIGTKLWIIAILLLGSYGMYATLREWLGLNPLSALVGALFYAASAWLPGVLVSGDYDLMGYFLLPFASLCMLRLLQRRWLGLLLPICFLTSLAEAAKIWPFVIAGTVLLIALFYRGQTGRKFWAVFVMWVLAFGVSLLLAAPKLIPMLHLIRLDLVNQTLPKGASLTYTSLRDLFQYILYPVPEDPNLQLGVGIVGLFLAIGGALLYWKRALGLLVLLLVAVIFGMGPASPIPVMAITHRIPIFNMVGSFGMYTSLVILFCVCGLIALGFDKLRRLIALSHADAHGWEGFLTDKAILLVTALGILIIARQSFLSNTMLFTVPDYSAPRESFYQVGDQSLMGVVSRYRETPMDHLLANQYYNLRRGVGTITWLGNFVFPEHTQPKYLIDANDHALPQSEYMGEVYCENPANGGCVVSDFGLTYNSIRFHVETSAPATIILNFNYDLGWQAPSYKVLNHSGLLAIEVPANVNDEVSMHYTDRFFMIGLAFAIPALVFWGLVGSLWIIKAKKTKN